MVRGQALRQVQANSVNNQPDISADAAMHEAVPAIAALGVSPIVRIPDLQPWMVKSKSSKDTRMV
jgi:hypothetical protein